jgi:hypothetical protein
MPESAIIRHNQRDAGARLRTAPDVAYLLVKGSAMPSIVIPPGLCQCGCGQPTAPAPQTHHKRGWIKGQPVRFIKGHNVTDMPTRPLTERFWEKVDRSGGPAACWPWQGYRNPHGYGTICTGESDTLTHRVAWELAHGPIPPGKVVCHRCDNPPCCHAECNVPGCEHLQNSPGCQSHLFLGTHLDNSADAVMKGRLACGPRLPQTKLTADQVRTIRARYTGRRGDQAHLAQEFGICRHTLQAILARKTWKHV